MDGRRVKAARRPPGRRVRMYKSGGEKGNECDPSIINSTQEIFSQPASFGSQIPSSLVSLLLFIQLLTTAISLVGCSWLIGWGLGGILFQSSAPSISLLKEGLRCVFSSPASLLFCVYGAVDLFATVQILFLIFLDALLFLFPCS